MGPLNFNDPFSGQLLNLKGSDLMRAVKSISVALNDILFWVLRRAKWKSKNDNIQIKKKTTI